MKTHTHTHRSRHDVACCGGIYESSLHMTFALQGHAHQAPTGNTACRLRREKKERAEHKGNGSERSDWISSEMEGEIEVWKGSADWQPKCIYTGWIWNLFSPSGHFSPPFLAAAWFKSSNTGWVKSSAPSLSLYLNCPRTPPISHWKHDPPPQLLHLNCIPIMSANNILPLLCSLLARCPKQWENQGYGGGETRKMNARKMKVDQYGCPRMWKGGLEL